MKVQGRIISFFRYIQTFCSRLSLREWLAFAGIQFLILVFFSVDYITDLKTEPGWEHLTLDLILLVLLTLSVVRAVFMTMQSREKLKNRQSKLEEEVGLVKKEVTRRRLGLSAEVDRQFEKWGLTEAEKEVAWLLVKGLASKEIASIRGSSEKTVRQQSLAVYSKSNLAGRAELAAFFLEDWLGEEPQAKPTISKYILPEDEQFINANVVPGVETVSKGDLRSQ